MKLAKLFLSAVFAFSFSLPIFAGDAEVITAILEANKKTDWSVNECATFLEGRIVELNLTNKTPEKDGLFILSSEIGQLSELKKIILNDNNLTELPVELYNCSKLTYLEAQNNQIKGLAPGFSKLTNLRELDLRSNRLTVIPEEIGRMRSLEIFKLWSNKLESLPTEIGEIPSLRELYLKGNLLSTLPLSLTKSRLKYIDVLDNSICDPPPAVNTWLKKFDEKYKSLQRCLGDKRFK